MTVCAGSPDETVRSAIAASKETGVWVVADTIGVKQQAARARQCAEWGVDMIYLHYGADQRKADATQRLDPMARRGAAPPFRFRSAWAVLASRTRVRAVQRGAELVADRASGYQQLPNPLAELRQFVREVRANYRPRDNG